MGAYTATRTVLKGILPPFVVKLGKSALGINHHEKPEFADVLGLPPRTAGSALVFGKRFEFIDGSDFLFLYDEIIRNEIYRFVTNEEEPLIIDGGANIGLSVVYFKRLYPRSQVIAFEPDPDIFKILQRNCQTFGLEGVELFERALWASDNTLGFRKEGSLGGRLAFNDNGNADVQVRTQRLRNLLNSRVTLLKLDIEGAETEVLEDCGAALANVQNLFVEYHSFADRPQSLHRLLAIIHDAGFRTHIHVYKPSPQPLFQRTIREGIDRVDMNLDIFGYRE
jgi:FkbM family methyltransferase